MPNSATGGYLTPTPLPANVEGKAFEDLLHDVIAGITGVDDMLVRPRDQGEPPTQPGRTIQWIAFGVLQDYSDAYAYVGHSGADGGADMLQQHETVEVIVSSYGPDADAEIPMRVLRSGLQIEQNREQMLAAGVGLVEASEIVAVPTLVKDKWLRRYDLRLHVRREIRRGYEVLNVGSANVKIKAQASNDTIIEDDITVEEPA